MIYLSKPEKNFNRISKEGVEETAIPRCLTVH